MSAADAHPDAALADRIIAAIQQGGAIGVDAYMAACLGDAKHGYYMGKDPFGTAGDFVTAPEISGLFGEMCGFYLAHMFELAGAPSQAEIVEFGPGRGTLMRDMHLIWQRLMPDLATLPVNLVETSPARRQHQGETVKPLVPVWHNTHQTLPATPLFGIANEFFDALPVAQLIWRNDAWHWRCVGLEATQLAFTDGPSLTPAEHDRYAAALPPSPDEGCIAEICPAGEEIMAALAARIGQHGGAMLIIDYGRNGNGGDSLQAVAAHRPVDVFHEPGRADLSHWVDFAALSRVAMAQGCRMIGPVAQGRFLKRIGLAARAEQASLSAEPETRRALLAAINRLTSPAQMGEVFKVALLVPPGQGTPPGFDEADHANQNKAS